MPISTIRRLNEKLNPAQKSILFPGVVSLALGGALGASAGVGIPCVLILSIAATYAYAKQSQQSAKWKKVVIATAVLPLSFVVNGISVVTGASITGKQIPVAPKAAKPESVKPSSQKGMGESQTNPTSETSGNISDEKPQNARNQESRKTDKPTSPLKYTQKHANQQQILQKSSPSKDEMIQALKVKGLKNKLPFMCTFSTSCAAKHYALLTALESSETSMQINQAVAKAKRDGVNKPDFISYFESEANKKRIKEQNAANLKKTELAKIQALAKEEDNPAPLQNPSAVTASARPLSVEPGATRGLPQNDQPAARTKKYTPEETLLQYKVYLRMAKSAGHNRRAAIGVADLMMNETSDMSIGDLSDVNRDRTCAAYEVYGEDNFLCRDWQK